MEEERPSCGEAGLKSGAARGLPRAGVAAWALRLRGLPAPPALTCMPEDKFSCIVENCMVAP